MTEWTRVAALGDRSDSYKALRLIDQKLIKNMVKKIALLKFGFLIKFNRKPLSLSCFVVHRWTGKVHSIILRVVYWGACPTGEWLMPIGAHIAAASQVSLASLSRKSLPAADRAPNGQTADSESSLKLKNKKKMVNINQLGQFLIQWSFVVSSWYFSPAILKFYEQIPAMKRAD